MSIGMDISLNGTCNNQKQMRNKGKNLLEIPETYVVIDIETTGLSPEYNDIIELSAVKVSKHEIIADFSTLVKPESIYIDDNGSKYYVDEFITKLTGITNDMLDEAPLFAEVVNKFLSFVGDSIVVGHNVNFDINFIYDNVLACTGIKFINDYCDLLRISRKLFPDFRNHKLATLSREFGIKPYQAHRGLNDCLTTFMCFEYCRAYIAENNIDLSMYKKGLDLRKIRSNKTEFNTEHPLFEKYCVFTGTLDAMKRADAAQLVVNLGGYCENNVTKKTNYLILGNNDYCKSIKGGKSSKQRKAEDLILSGQDLTIMPESTFYDLIRSLTITEAKDIVKEIEKAECAALLFSDSLYWYITPCSTDEVDELESSNGECITNDAPLYCFNQFTGEYSTSIN